MWVTLALAVGSVLLVVSGFTWVARRDEVEAVERIGALSLVTLGDAATGELCAIRGVVKASDTVEDPVTGEPVVFYEARLLRSDRPDVLYAKSGGRSLRLEDDSQRVAFVELKGAEIAIPPAELEQSDGAPSAKMAELLASIEKDAPRGQPSARYAIEHRAIGVGDQLTLVGVPRRDDSDELRFDAKDPLFLTPEPLEELQARQREDLRAMDAMLRIGVALGIASIVGGVALVLLLG